MSGFDHISASPITWPAGWPRARTRKRAKFLAKSYGMGGTRPLSVNDGAERVQIELKRLGVQDGGFIISTNLVLRLDGYPRSDQREPSDPGAAVYWTKGRGHPHQVMAIDIYDRVADNLGAIAASLEALRAIERHGGAQILERAFTGFTALPPPPSCWQELGIGAGASAEAIDAAWKHKIRACRMTNPHGDHPSEPAINAARDEALRLVRA